jgi:hypothetical protein
MLCNMSQDERAWMGPISCKKYLVGYLPLKDVVRQYFSISIVAGYFTNLIRYSGQYLTSWTVPQGHFFPIKYLIENLPHHYKIFWAISYNIKGASVGPIFIKNMLSDTCL